MKREPGGSSGSFGWSFEETERRQFLRGLELTPVERLRWLDRARQELAELLGRAKLDGDDVATPDEPDR